MNRSTSESAAPRAGQSSLPAVHIARPVSTEVYPPHEGHPHMDRPDINPQIVTPPSEEHAPGRGRKYPTLRVALVCLALAAGASAVLVPAVRSALGGGDSISFGQSIGNLLLQGGLPPTNRPLFGAGERESETEALPGSDTGASSESETNVDTAYVTEPTTGETVGEPTTESESAPATESGTASSAETEPISDTPPAESETPPVESEIESSPGSETDTETEPEPETKPTMPAGAFPIVREDKSEPERPVGYIVSTAEHLPPSIPGEGTRLWSTADAPTVLIIHSHPYEGYSDGGDWYDPHEGDLARTDSQSAPDGVVALGARLTRILRERGVTVIHLRVPVAEGESAASTYERTESMVRYYCSLYPDIGLVLDLRRSAELTEAGDILRTAGELNGTACAQLRFSVSGGRKTETVSRDIAVAVALRRGLWAISPTVSRPVWVKSGQGIASDLDAVAHLTVELGSAGNTFEEAERLAAPLGQVVADLVLG